MSNGTTYAKWLGLGLLTIVLLYVLALFLFFAGGYVIAEAGRRLRASRLKSAMKRTSLATDPSTKRVSAWPTIEAHLARGGVENAGTLILDHPCLGWNDLDVWWIPESVRSAATADGVNIAQANSGDDDLEGGLTQSIVERWCAARYLNPETGRAQLVQCTHWDFERRKTLQRIAAIKATYPKLETVAINTCFLQFDRGK